MWKKIALISIGLAAGFVLGCILTMAYNGYTMATAIFMFQEKEIYEMEEAAIGAYHNQPNEVAIWALENYINTLNRLQQERSYTEAENPYFILNPEWSLMLSYARLGQLYKKTGETEKSQNNFEQALSYGKRLEVKGLDKEEDVVELLNKLDKHRNENLKEAVPSS